MFWKASCCMLHLLRSTFQIDLAHTLRAACKGGCHSVALLIFRFVGSGLVPLWAFWALAGAFQRHGVGGFVV